MAALLGLPLPLSVAADDVTDDAALVVTVGGAAVVNCTINPNDIPDAFCVMAQ